MLNKSTNLHGQFERFMRAARSGDIKSLDEIYATNKRILQSRAAFGSTCVHIAAENGRIATLEWLRDRGANFGAKTRPRNQTPMHFAAARGQTQTLMWLCEHTQALGCDLDAKDYRQRTASDLAKQYEFYESARVLDNAKQVPVNELHRSTQFGILYSNTNTNTDSNSNRDEEGKNSDGLNRGLNGLLHGTGTVSSRSWETYTREMLIDGLSDLKELHESELESRKQVEQKQMVEIEKLKYEINHVRVQMSELKSLVEHLVRKDREAVDAKTNKELEKRLEESNRSKYLNGLTIGGVRVETEHIHAATKEADGGEDGDGDGDGDGEKGKEIKENGENEEDKEEDKEEDVVPSRPMTSQSLREVEGGWGATDEEASESWSGEVKVDDDTDIIDSSIDTKK